MHLYKKRVLHASVEFSNIRLAVLEIDEVHNSEHRRTDGNVNSMY